MHAAAGYVVKFLFCLHGVWVQVFWKALRIQAAIRKYMYVKIFTPWKVSLEVKRAVYMKENTTTTTNNNHAFSVFIKALGRYGLFQSIATFIFSPYVRVI